MEARSIETGTELGTEMDNDPETRKIGIRTSTEDMHDIKAEIRCAYLA